MCREPAITSPDQRHCRFRHQAQKTDVHFGQWKQVSAIWRTATICKWGRLLPENLPSGKAPEVHLGEEPQQYTRFAYTTRGFVVKHNACLCYDKRKFSILRMELSFARRGHRSAEMSVDAEIRALPLSLSFEQSPNDSGLPRERSNRSCQSSSIELARHSECAAENSLFGFRNKIKGVNKAVKTLGIVGIAIR